MRVPRSLLDKTLQVELPAGSSPSGQAFGEPFTLACHYEDRAALKLDQRTSSPTAGTEIVMTTQIIGQLDRRLVVGARVTFPSGAKAIVANARHYEHRSAPSNTELWAV